MVSSYAHTFRMCDFFFCWFRFVSFRWLFLCFHLAMTVNKFVQYFICNTKAIIAFLITIISNSSKICNSLFICYHPYHLQVKFGCVCVFFIMKSIDFYIVRASHYKCCYFCIVFNQSTDQNRIKKKIILLNFIRIYRCVENTSVHWIRACIVICWSLDDHCSCNAISLNSRFLSFALSSNFNP